MSAGAVTTTVESAAVVENVEWQQLVPPSSGESSESSSGCEDGRLINCRTLPLFNYTDLAPPLVGGGTGDNVNADILQDDNCPSVPPPYDNSRALSQHNYSCDDNTLSLSTKTIDGNLYDYDNDNNNNDNGYPDTEIGHRIVRNEQQGNVGFSLEFGYRVCHVSAICLSLSLTLYLLIKFKYLYYLLLLTLLLLFIVIVYSLLLMLLLSYVTVIVFTTIIFVYYCRRHFHFKLLTFFS